MIEGILPRARKAERGAADAWCTPPLILDHVRRVAPGGTIDLDPCSNPGSLVAARLNVGDSPALDEMEYPSGGRCVTGDGLAVGWRGFVFVNPPYSDTGRWIEKGLASLPDAEVLYLIPPSTASWFHRLDGAPATFCFLRRRIAFLRDGKPVTGNPRGSMAVLLSEDEATHVRFREVFAPLGTFLRPVV